MRIFREVYLIVAAIMVYQREKGKYYGSPSGLVQLN